jgi:DNA-binding CsgD family transcriptional regulator
MSRPFCPPTEHLDQIHQLWDDLPEFGAAHSGEAVVHLLSIVADAVDAQNAYWFGAVRLTTVTADPLCGWRPRGIQYLKPLLNDEVFTRDRIRSLDRGGVDESTAAQARLSGTFRANRLCDLVSPEWFAGALYKGYIDRGVHDSLVVAAPVSTMAEAYYGFLRTRADDPFTEAQRDLASYALRPLKWFHRQVLLAHGLHVARTPLSPIERKVLGLLLTDRTEKAMAVELGVSPSSIHTYVRDVLRKFGVSGRKGLIALWLGRQS